VARSTKFNDNTFLYRFGVHLAAKNISDSAVHVQAMVTEIFLGSVPEAEVGKATLISLPYSSLEQASPGPIKWTRLGAYSQQLPEIDPELKKAIADFPVTAGGIPGTIEPNESHEWNAGFILRARPTNIVAAVIMFWATDESNGLRVFEQTRSELLSEAEDASAARVESPAPFLSANEIVQHTESSSPGIVPNRDSRGKQ
jgi:hypothetical protein